MRVVSSVLLVCAGLASGCVVPFAIPGTRADGGFSVDHQATARVGASLLSLRKEPTAQADVSAGYTAGVIGHDGVTKQGGYLDLGWSQRLDPGTQLTIGPGLALVTGGDGLDPVGYVRGAVEFYTPVDGAFEGDGRCGGMVAGALGRVGIGVYVDVERPLAATGGVTAVAGLTVRLPGTVGLVLGVPGCK